MIFLEGGWDKMAQSARSVEKDPVENKFMKYL